jgi:hypothetical protein
MGLSGASAAGPRALRFDETIFPADEAGLKRRCATITHSIKQ